MNLKIKFNFLFFCFKFQSFKFSPFAQDKLQARNLKQLGQKIRVLNLDPISLNKYLPSFFFSFFLFFFVYLFAFQWNLGPKTSNNRTMRFLSG